MERLDCERGRNGLDWIEDALMMSCYLSVFLSISQKEEMDAVAGKWSEREVLGLRLLFQVLLLASSEIGMIFSRILRLLSGHERDIPFVLRFVQFPSSFVSLTRCYSIVVLLLCF